MDWEEDHNSVENHWISFHVVAAVDLDDDDESGKLPAIGQALQYTVVETVCLPSKVHLCSFLSCW